MEISYVFDNYEDREKAADEVYRDCGGSKAYDRKTNSDGYILTLTSQCEDFSRGTFLCAINGGRVYSY